MKRFAIAALLLAVATGCATSPTGRSQLMLISPEAAIVESRKAYLSTVSELDAENKLVDDPKLADKVATITGRLVTEAIAMYPTSADWEWSVAIIDDPETVNAWCMAGGRMAVYTGLFEKLKLTDDEFAQIMGHEISHALANHTAERMSRAMATSLGVLAVGVASDRPAATMAGVARLIAGGRFTSKLCNLFISNVPGPQQTLYMNGAKMIHTFGMAPLADGMGLFIATPSYNGEMSFNIISDREMLPDIEFFRECLESAHAELLAAK